MYSVYLSILFISVCFGATFTFYDETDQPINFQIWTAGHGFYVTGCNTYPQKHCDATTDCVWYDLYAIDMNNKAVGIVKGAYCGGHYCLAGNVTAGQSVLGVCNSPLKN